MDLDVGVDPEWQEPAPTASERHAGNLGFAGTARNETAAPAGLTTLAGDEFGGGPSMPMIPGTWAPEEGSGSHDPQR
jgi:PPE-repeat protein